MDGGRPRRAAAFLGAAQRALVAVVGLAPAACGAPPGVSSTAPADVQWIALVEPGEPGAVGRTSPLSRWDGDALPLFAPEEAPLLILGYSDPQIAAVARDNALATIESEPLRAAEACEASLPPPVWSGRWSGGETVEPGTLDAALTASWVAAGCVDSDDLWVDVSCQDVRCVVGLERRGCALSIDLSACGFGRPIGAARLDGLCIDFAGTQQSCEAAPAPPLAAAVSSCRGEDGVCTLTWYREPVPLGLSTRSVSIPGAGSWRPDRAQVPGAIASDIADRGHAWDLAVVGRRALVSSPAGVPRELCELTRDGLLHVIDGDTARVVGTATAPPCLVDLAAAPSGEWMLGAFVTDGEWWLGRFDGEGRLLARTRADPRPRGAPSPPRPDAADWLGVELVRGPGSWTMLWRLRLGLGALAITYDDALQPLAYTSIPGVHATSVLPLDADTLLFTTNVSGEVLYYAPGATSPRRRVLLEGHSGLPAVTLYSAARAGSSVVIAAGKPGALFTLAGSGAVLGQSAIFDRGSLPHFALPLPWDPERMLVFGVSDERSSTISLFEPGMPRFLPGTGQLGDAVVSRAVVDGQQRIWTLQAWTGEVVIMERDAP